MQCGKGHESDVAEAIETEHEIQDKDIVLMFSDGVSENLFEFQICNCVNTFLDGVNLKDAHGCAKLIAEFARATGKTGD